MFSLGRTKPSWQGWPESWALEGAVPGLLQMDIQHRCSHSSTLPCQKMGLSATPPPEHIWKKKLQHNHCLNTTLLFSLLCKTSSWEFCYSLKFKYIPPSTFLGPPECIHTSAWKVAHAPWAAGCILGWVLFGLDILLFHLFLRCKPHNEFHGFCEQL